MSRGIDTIYSGNEKVSVSLTPPPDIYKENNEIVIIRNNTLQKISPEKLAIGSYSHHYWVREEGWYTIAYANQGYPMSCELTIKRPWGNASPEVHKVLIVANVNRNAMKEIYSLCNYDNQQCIDGIRICKNITQSGSNNTCYIDLHYNSSNQEGLIITIQNGYNYHGSWIFTEAQDNILTPITETDNTHSPIKTITLGTNVFLGESLLD